jgi:hypothetical protein
MPNAAIFCCTAVMASALRCCASFEIFERLSAPMLIQA